MNRVYEAISKLLQEQLTEEDNPSSDLPGKIIASQRDDDLDERSVSGDPEDEIVTAEEDNVSPSVSSRDDVTVDELNAEPTAKPAEEDSLDVSAFTPERDPGIPPEDPEARKESKGEPAALTEQSGSDNETPEGFDVTKSSEADFEKLDIPVEQFQLDAEASNQAIAIQERDVEETLEAVITTPYGSDIITQSLIPNDLGFDFNEAISKIHEDLNLDVGFDNLAFSEPEIVMPDLAPIPSHVYERQNVFASATNMRLMDQSQ